MSYNIKNPNAFSDPQAIIRGAVVTLKIHIGCISEGETNKRYKIGKEIIE